MDPSIDSFDSFIDQGTHIDQGTQVLPVLHGFMRYPGGKRKLLPEISASIQEVRDGHTRYIEPFIGGGSVMLSQIENFMSIVINDRDRAISEIWHQIQQDPTHLIELINGFKPSLEAYDQYKTGIDALHKAELALAKIALHQMSFSGLGEMAGGPIGGQTQTSKYAIDCRWNPDYIIKSIRDINRVFRSRDVVVSSLDFGDVMTSDDGFYYLDPPYYEQGPALYRHSFTLDDHQRLANRLRDMVSPFVLSYDDCQEIRELYNWAVIKQVEVGYSIAGSQTKTELIIRRK